MQKQPPFYTLDDETKQILEFVTQLAMKTAQLQQNKETTDIVYDNCAEIFMRFGLDPTAFTVIKMHDEDIKKKEKSNVKRFPPQFKVLSGGKKLFDLPKPAN